MFLALGLVYVYTLQGCVMTVSVHVCVITHTVDRRHPRVGGKHAII